MKTVYLGLIMVLAVVVRYFPSLNFQFMLDDYAILVIMIELFAKFSVRAIKKIILGMRYLKQSEALNPHIILLGNAHGMKGELQLARNYFSQVLQLEPNYASAQQAYQITQTRLINENS